MGVDSLLRFYTSNKTKKLLDIKIKDILDAFFGNNDFTK